MPTPTATAGGTSGTGTSGALHSTGNGNNGISTGAIAGAAVGGILVIAILVGLLFWLLQKRKAKGTYHQARTESPSGNYVAPSETHRSRIRTEETVLEKQELDSRQKYELDSLQQPRGQQYNLAELSGRWTVHEMDGTGVGPG